MSGCASLQYSRIGYCLQGVLPREENPSSIDRSQSHIVWTALILVSTPRSWVMDFGCFGWIYMAICKMQKNMVLPPSPQLYCCLAENMIMFGIIIMQFNKNIRFMDFPLDVLTLKTRNHVKEYGNTIAVPELCAVLYFFSKRKHLCPHTLSLPAGVAILPEGAIKFPPQPPPLSHLCFSRSMWWCMTLWDHFLFCIQK